MDTATDTLNKTEGMNANASSAFREGKEKINQYTENVASKTPSNTFVFAALASIAVSATLQLRGNRQWSLFIGQWAPSFLLFGIYNKLVKSFGAD